MNLYILKSIVFTILLLFGTQYIKSQDQRLFQFFGRLRNDSLQPLPYTNIIIINKSKGTISDYEGRFSFLAGPNDTILFSTVGYKRKFIIIGDTIISPVFYNIILEQDTIHISEVRFYRWQKYKDFKNAFLALEFHDRDMENALKNLEIIQTQIKTECNLSPNANINYRNVCKQQYDKCMQPGIPILNPFAWLKFFRAVKNGDFKNQEK